MRPSRPGLFTHPVRIRRAAYKIASSSSSSSSYRDIKRKKIESYFPPNSERQREKRDTPAWSPLRRYNAHRETPRTFFMTERAKIYVQYVAHRLRSAEQERRKNCAGAHAGEVTRGCIMPSTRTFGDGTGGERARGGEKRRKRARENGKGSDAAPKYCNCRDLCGGK